MSDTQNAVTGPTPLSSMKERSKGIAVGISASHEPLPMDGLSDDETLDSTAEVHWVNGYRVATNASPCAAGEEFHSRDRTFNSLTVLAARGDTALFQMVPGVRRDHPWLKLILKIIGRNHDELPSDLITQADMIIPCDP